MKGTLERMGWTFVETFLTFTVAEPVIELIGGDLNISLWQVALGSSIAASLVVLKDFAKARLAKLSK